MPEINLASGIRNKEIMRFGNYMRGYILIILLGASLGLSAQKTLEVGLFGGGSYYLGDLNPGYHFLNTKPAYGLVARFNLDSRWTVRLTGYRGDITGDDNVTGAVESRGLYFDSQVTDFSAVIELNFLNYITGSTRNFVAPYIFGGLGVFMFDPRADGVALRDLGTEGQNIGFDGRSRYQTTAVAVPFGFGFKYSLNKRLAFAFEWGLRKTFTDYIDDVSTTYYLLGEGIDPGNAEEYLSDPTMSHRPYEARGNASTRDWYAFFGLTATYKFVIGGNKRCTDSTIRDDY
ncbi:MAG TPA: DUF6089 family protein [Bacteroidales bacterium]|nr:DUF6089 family protein [Bacteroidales bacterium]